MSDQQATAIIEDMVACGLLEKLNPGEITITQKGKNVQKFLTHVREVDGV